VGTSVVTVGSAGDVGMVVVGMVAVGKGAVGMVAVGKGAVCMVAAVGMVAVGKGKAVRGQCRRGTSVQI
jgi:hypothetical protein